MTGHDVVNVVVHQMTRASDRILLIELRPTAGDDLLPPFEAGAHIDVHLGALVRQYSLLGPAQDRHRYRIGVLRELAGRGGSAAIHDSVRVGDLLRISLPRNTFPMVSAIGHTVLLAGGIGVTPLVAMAERLHQAGESFELHVYSASERTSPLREYLAGRPWAERVWPHYSDTGDSFRTGPPAAVHAPAPGARLYVCGPAGFIDAATACAAAAGWPADAVHAERFAPAASVRTDGDSFAVIAASTGRRMEVGQDETIAQVLERNGFEVFLSCEQGICGSCLTGVLEGVPDHRDEVQSDAEHAANSQINICCSRARTATLTLDV